MTTPRQKLQTLLFELFQFDSADLNFGIYAVMNRKRAEIKHFIHNKLLAEVERGLQQVANQSHDEAKTNFEVARNELLKTLGTEALKGSELAPEFAALRAIPVVQNYLKAKAEQERSVVSLELEMDIYNALYEFFSRYYKDGDFMPERRYGNRDSYAIPYNGDEVYLHWANRDQYYVKSSEYFTNYHFTVKGGLGTASTLTVAFVLTQAETARDNNKAPNRYFIQPLEQPPTWDAAQNTLRIPFQYRPLSDAEKQELGTRGNHIQPRLNELSHAQIGAALHTGSSLEHIDTTTRTLLYDRLHAPHRSGDADSSLSSSEGEPDELAYQLKRYTAANSRDFFVHKDLAGFLTREFEYYLKAEVADLDNLQSFDPVRLQQEGAKIATTRTIGSRIIAFLDQIESFQKLLFLKPKFVLQSDYCLTLDKIPAADRARLYPQIAANPRQRAEWQALYGVTLTADADLTHHPHLMVDTAFFAADFKLDLLACFEDIDEACDGLLIHGENFQALGLIHNLWTEEIGCIYIDPPYNTSATEINYINGYKHSSWLTLTENRLESARRLLKPSGVLCVTIDDVEFHRLHSLIVHIFGEEMILGVVPIRSNPSGRSTLKGFSISHEYAIFVANSETSSIGRLPRSEKQKARYKEEDTQSSFEWVNFRKHGGLNANRNRRPRLFYPIYVSSGGKIRIPEMEWNQITEEWIPLQKPAADEDVVFPINPNGEEKTWKWSHSTVLADLSEVIGRTDKDGLPAVYVKSRMTHEDVLPTTWWDKKLFSATDYGTNLLGDILGSTTIFAFPKSIHATTESLLVSDDNPDGLYLDFFGGSGTTAHAVMNLNREDDGSRKYILVEMGEHFNTVLKPRIQKVAYAAEWKDGKPVNDGLFSTGLSHMFQYLRLESYDDTFHNIAFPSDGPQPQLWGLDDYLLTYMLPHETQESPTLLNLAQLRTPFDYKLKVATTGGALQETSVDLITTFNFLIGLRVRTLRSFHQAAGTGQLVRVTGVNRQGERICILWRNVPDSPAALDAERDWLQAQVLADVIYDRLYINGDTTLPNATLLDAEFKRLLLPREGR